MQMLGENPRDGRDAHKRKGKHGKSIGTMPSLTSEEAAYCKYIQSPTIIESSGMKGGGIHVIIVQDVQGKKMLEKCQ